MNGFFALLAAISNSIRDLATRAVPKEISTVQIAGWGGVALVIGGFLAHLISGAPLPQPQYADILPFLVLAIGLTVGVFSVSAAMRLGDVSVVAPFRYTRLPFGLLVGVLYFGEQLTPNMVAGSVIVAGSGLYVWWREVRAPKLCADENFCGTFGPLMPTDPLIEATTAVTTAVTTEATAAQRLPKRLPKRLPSNKLNARRYSKSVKANQGQRQKTDPRQMMGLTA